MFALKMNLWHQYVQQILNLSKITIQALLQQYELYSLNIDKIVSGKVDKNHAIIVGRLCISSKTRYGITSKGLQRYLFIPRNRAYPNYIVASKLKQTSIDVYCSNDKDRNSRLFKKWVEWGTLHVLSYALILTHSFCVLYISPVFL